jgi:hypothetical protein
MLAASRFAVSRKSMVGPVESHLGTDTGPAL